MRISQQCALATTYRSRMCDLHAEPALPLCVYWFLSESSVVFVQCTVHVLCMGLLAAATLLRRRSTIAGFQLEQPFYVPAVTPLAAAPRLRMRFLVVLYNYDSVQCLVYLFECVGGYLCHMST